MSDQAAPRPAIAPAGSLAERVERVRTEQFNKVATRSATAETAQLRAWRAAEDAWFFRFFLSTGIASWVTSSIIFLLATLDDPTSAWNTPAGWVGLVVLCGMASVLVGGIGGAGLGLTIGHRRHGSPRPVQVNATTAKAHELVLSSAETLRTLDAPIALATAIDCIAKEADELLDALIAREPGTTNPELRFEHRRLVDLACQAAAAVESFREHRLTVEAAVHEEFVQHVDDYGLADATAAISAETATIRAALDRA